MRDERLTIGALSRRTGVAASALRYYEELGLVRPAARVSGQRRYDASAVDVVAVVRFLNDVGFTLSEIKEMTRSRKAWRPMAERKLAEIDAHLADVKAARTAIVHGLACPKEHMLECPNFWTIVRERLDGRTPEDGEPG